MKDLKRAMAILLTFSMAISLFSGFVSASETLPRAVENKIETLSETAEDEIEALPEIVEGELETPSGTTEDEPKTLPETTEAATDITSVNLALGKKRQHQVKAVFQKKML